MPLRETLFRAARRSGVMAIVRASGWRRRRLLILCYHGVSTRDEHEWNGELYVPPGHLAARLRYLRAHRYAILPLDEACRRLYDGTLPAQSVSITFDDGAADFATAALPILREFDAPATVYLASYYATTPLPVFDTILSYVLWLGRASGADIAPLCESPAPLPVSTESERERAWTALYDFAARAMLDAYAKDGLVEAVATLVGVSYRDVKASNVLRIMTPEAVDALPTDLIDVQLHTHRHRTPIDHSLFARELRDNARYIRAFTGDRQLAHFCYPSGDYRASFLPWLQEAGVKFATTCVPGLAAPSDHPLLLPRLIDTTQRSEATFAAWASGFAGFLPKRRAYRLDSTRLQSAS
jgi:peptidoglycan/xylan/chitin deacetylase (PgdA/CDA1 family)